MQGFLFNYVTCANYTTEIWAWIGFNIATQSLLGWVFLLCGGGQMTLWAIAKHKRLRRVRRKNELPLSLFRKLGTEAQETFASLFPLMFPRQRGRRVTGHDLATVHAAKMVARHFFQDATWFVRSWSPSGLRCTECALNSDALFKGTFEGVCGCSQRGHLGTSYAKG